MKRVIHILFFTGLLSAVACSSATAQRENSLIIKGNKKYRLGEFDQALPFYEKAMKENSANPVARYNAGDAFFRKSQFAEAEASFDHAGAPGNELALRQKAFYNKGVALSKQNKLEESITAYKNAVILNPSDADARMNLQKALLEQKKRKPPEKEKEKDKKEDKQKDSQKKDQPPPSQSKLTRKQVEQLLKALQQREQQAQQKMQQSRSRAGARPDKDW